MALSEHEQRLLDEMEQRLYQSEADVVQTPSGPRRQLNLRSVVLGILLGLVGVGVLILGVAMQQLWLGLVGFAAMMGGTVLAFTRGKDIDADLFAELDSEKRAGSAKESLSDRLEKRWDERMGGER